MAAGNISVIVESSDDEESDHEKAALKNKDIRSTPKDQGQGMKPLKNINPPMKTSFSGFKAKQLQMFFKQDLKDNKVDVNICSKTNEVILSCNSPPLLATKKQKLEKLLESLKYEDIAPDSAVGVSIENIITKNSLNILSCEGSDNTSKLRICYKDQYELQKLKDLLKNGNSTGEKDEKKGINRRSRKFCEEEGASNSLSTNSKSDRNDMDTKTPKYNLQWQSSKHTAPSTSVSNVVGHCSSAPSSYLGDNVQVKLTITQNGICTKIYQGSIIRAKVDAIVNAANDRLNNCGGIAEVISKAAGDEMESECKEKVKGSSKIKVSGNIVTKAGKLPCRWIIHAVGPRWSDYRDKEKALWDLYKTVVNILQTACDRRMKSVVMPPISSGIFGVPKEACAAMYIKALLEFSEKCLDNKMKEFHIVDNKADMLDFICKEYDDGHEKGRTHLEPRKVLERLGIPLWGTGYPWSNVSYSNSKTGNSSLRGADGTATDQRTGFNKAQNRQNSSTCVLKESSGGCDEYVIGKGLKVLIYQGNIIDLKNVSVLVCAEGRDVDGQGYLSKQIMQKATKGQQKGIQKLFKGAEHPHFSQILQLTTGFLHYKLVYYAIIKKFPNTKPQPQSIQLLQNTISNILTKANTKNKNKKKISIAMPLLGTGSIQNSEYLQQYADAVCECILRFSKAFTQDSKLQEIQLVNHQASPTRALQTAFSAMRENRPVSTPSQMPMKRSPVKDFRRTEFDHSKYIAEETWKAQKQNEVNFEDFIEICHKRPTNKGQDATKEVETDTKRNSVSQGNLTFIESSDEEDCSGTEERLSQNQPAADTMIKDNFDYDNADSSEDENLTCVVCMDEEMEDPVILKTCRHQFCRDCIKDYFSHKPACPVCNTVYGDMFGNQPKEGKATVYRDATSLPGFPCSTIIINYEIPDGIQTDEHPNPGESFTGVSRQAYLPDNEDGRMVLKMLKHAFEHRLTFTVGFSRTSGKDNVVTWNDIHHKTRRDGGPEKFGYPDPEYIERVKEELAAKGISEN